MQSQQAACINCYQILKFTWKYKGTRIVKRKDKVGILTLPDFKTYYKPALIKIVWNWCKNRQIDQWNKIEPRNRPTHMWTIYFKQRCKGNSVEKGWSFQQKTLEQFDIYIQKSELPFVTHNIYKFNYKWVINLNVKTQIIKLLEENIGKNHYYFELGKVFQI